ncbi:MAG: hypothetical protein HUK28_04955 [Methanobrevibacter sp.]|nr:hypothetical protein [Methanobrevibacter sp.]
MHGLLYDVKSDTEKYDGADIQLRLKIFFKNPDKQWEDNIANAFFENDYKRGSPEEVKGECDCVDSAIYDEFYGNLQKLADSGIIYSQCADLDIGGVINYSKEGIIVTCHAEITN